MGGSEGKRLRRSPAKTLWNEVSLWMKEQNSLNGFLFQVCSKSASTKLIKTCNHCSYLQRSFSDGRKHSAFLLDSVWKVYVQIVRQAKKKWYNVYWRKLHVLDSCFITPLPNITLQILFCFQYHRLPFPASATILAKLLKCLLVCLMLIFKHGVLILRVQKVFILKEAKKKINICDKTYDISMRLWQFFFSAYLCVRREPPRRWNERKENGWTYFMLMSQVGGCATWKRSNLVNRWKWTKHCRNTCWENKKFKRCSSASRKTFPSSQKMFAFSFAFSNFLLFSFICGSPFLGFCLFVW